MTDPHATRWWLPSLTLVGALLTGSLGATPPSEADPALLAVELPHVELTAGQEFQVLGRFQELVGRRLLLVDCPIPFELDAEADWPVLRSPDLRRKLLSIRVRVSVGDPLRLEAVTIETGPAPGEVFANRRARFGKLDRARQIAVSCWAIQFGGELDDQELTERGRETLLGVLEKALASASPGPGVSHWLETGQRLLGADARWTSAVVEFGNRHAHDSELAAVLRRIGYNFDRTQWRPRAELLAEIGMVLRKDNVGGTDVSVAMTRERALLENIIDVTGLDRRTSLMLRGLTKQQYQRHMKNHDVVEGMERNEVVGAWGYPGRLTWFRRKERLYEVWLYPRGEVCLADGRVFHLRDSQAPEDP